MASKGEPSPNVPESLPDPHPLYNPVDFIQKATEHLLEKEKELVQSFSHSFNVVGHPFQEQPAEKLKEPSFFKKMKDRLENKLVKILHLKRRSDHDTDKENDLVAKKKDRVVGKENDCVAEESEIGSELGMDAEFAMMLKSVDPLVTMKKMVDFKKNLESDLKRLEQAVHINSVEEDLEKCEKEVLDDIESTSVVLFADEQIDSDSANEIHAVMFQPEHPLKDGDKVPLVMMHGIGGGLAAFHKNFGHLNYDRYVYGIDLPGFARSSRTTFPSDAEASRDMMVEMIERWRDRMRIEKFIILGHSFGGYISAAYAVKYPSRVRHLVLVDPWGILSKDEDTGPKQTQLWETMAMDVFNFLHLDPMDPLRWSIPLGAILMKVLIPDNMKDGYGEKCMKYFLYANGKKNATGEKAFACISGYSYIWPKDGMEMRQKLIDLYQSVPITFIYGGDSNFHNEGGLLIQKRRANVLVIIVNGASHHVHAEKHHVFNEAMKGVLDEVDTEADQRRENKIIEVPDTDMLLAECNNSY